MNDFEKVEKLVEKANVTYEEAKAALDAAGGDLLDALVLLEKQGRTRGPEQSTYSTSYESQDDYEDVRQHTNAYQQDQKRYSRTAANGVRKIWSKLRSNAVTVERHGDEVLRAPLWLFALIFIFSWRLALVAVIISLFMDCKYHFVGNEKFDSVNRFMDMAGDAAEHVKEDFTK
ncbi:MAG: hypothetical protein IKE58_06560 [Blautia sp.]|nr:hypothetical protein [Blautia sp.]